MRKPDPASILILVANIITIFLFFYLGWEVYDVLLLYIIQNAIIGIFMLGRIIMTKDFAMVDHFTGTDRCLKRN